MLEWKPDYEDALNRLEAWWHGEVLDRPPVWITAPNGRDGSPFPERAHATIRDRWFDTEFVLDGAEAWMSRTAYLGGALPIWWPNHGPEVYTAFLGCPMEYTETTSWALPVLTDWSKIAEIAFDPENDYFQKIQEMTEAGIERFRGRAIVGYTDLHPGADGACAFRDPQQLCTDLMDAPDQVRQLLLRVEEPFGTVFDTFASRLEAEGYPVTTWMAAAGRGRVHVPSNDFSCMVSPAMMEGFFLDITIEECRTAERNVYHLDGRDAIKHLDLLLGIPELHAIQPTIGSGDVFDEQWMDVILRTRAAGKSIHLSAGWDLMRRLMAELPPEGILFITSAPSIEAAEDLIHEVARWKR